MGIKVANNAFGTLASGINSSATSITLTTGQGARFPTLSVGDYFYATLIDTSNNLEIVKVTARSTDVLTVVRAQESTTARAYSTGDRIEIRLTAATFTDAVNGQDGDKGDITVSSGGSVWTIDNNAVTTAKINDLAVTTAKVNDLAVTSAKLAANAVTNEKINAEAVSLAKLGYSGLFMTQFAQRTSQQSLSGDSGWQDHLSMTFTVGKQCNALFLYSSSSSFESGVVQGFARILVDGNMIGANSCVAKQSTANAAGAGTVFWELQNISAGSHTVKVQVRNTQSGSTWITPYWSADGQTANTLGALFYA